MSDYTRAFARAVTAMNKAWPSRALNESTVPASRLYTRRGWVYTDVQRRSLKNFGKSVTERQKAPTTDYMWHEAEKVSENRYRIANYRFQRYPEYGLTGDAEVHKIGYTTLKSGRDIFDRSELLDIFDKLDELDVKNGWKETSFQPFQNRYFRDILTAPEKTKAPESPTP